MTWTDLHVQRRSASRRVLALFFVFPLSFLGCGGNEPMDAMQSNTLAPTGDAAWSQPVDGISCDVTEQVLFHIHAHLAIFVEGQQKWLAAGVGIGPPLEFGGDFVVGGSCFSWLHTHDQTGVIHIESPIERIFTLGNFFDIWGQPLSAARVGPAKGMVTAYVNGAPFIGDPSIIPLRAYDLIQLDVGAPRVAPQPFVFPPGL